MRIEDSHAHLIASRHNAGGHHGKEGLESIKERRDDVHGHEGRALGRHKRPDPVAISDEARARFESMKKRFSETRERVFQVPGGLDPKGFLNRLMLGAFAGRDIDVTGLIDPAGDSIPANGVQAFVAPNDSQALSGSTGFEASIEQLSFSASGTIKTADGEEVGFTLELSVTRASMSGYSAGAAGGENGISVSFGGSSAELYSMSFEFNINDDEGVQFGTGSFRVDKPEVGADEDEGHEIEESGEEGSLMSSVPDFLKMLRRAEFTSTYPSISRMTMEASSSFTESLPIDTAIPQRLPVDATQPLDVLV